MHHEHPDPTQVASELDRRIAERTRELAEANEELRLQVGLLQHLPVSAWTLKPDGTPDFVNQVWLEYSGQNLDFIRSHPEAWMTAVHPDDREKASKDFWDGVRSGQGFAIETRSLRARDLTYRWHLQQAVPLRDADGKVLRFVGTTTDIDDQKRAQEELRASEANLRRVIDTIPTLSWCNLPDGPNEFLSKSWHEYTGLSPAEARGWGWSTAFHPDDLPPLMKRWEKLLISGEPGEIEARLRRHDGAHRWFLIRVAPFRDETGTISRWYGTSTDIHDRKLADEALRASEAQLRLIFDSIPGILGVLSPSGEVEMVNQRNLDYFGLTTEQLKSWKGADVLHPDDMPRAMAKFTHALATGTPLFDEQRYRRADGEYRWFDVRIVPARDTQGRITRWFTFSVDIHDRKLAEEALRASENDLRKILDCIPGLVSKLNLAGQNELVNRPLLEYFGKTIEELNAWKGNDVVHPDDMERVAAEFTHSLTTGTLFDGELRYRRADGVYRWFQVRSLPARDIEGTVSGWYSLLTDIDDRKRAEEALRASETNLRQIVDSIPGLVCTMDATGEIQQLNRPLLEYFGKAPEELKGWKMTNAVHPDDLPEVIEAYTYSVTTGTPYEIEHRCRRADGVYRWFQVRALAVRDADGHITGWYVLLSDIEDRKRAEEALRASENNFRQIVDNIPGLVATLSPSGEVELVNQQFRDYFGKSLDEIKNWRVNDVLHPDDLHRVEAAFTHAMSMGSGLVEEFRYRRADGIYRWFHARVFPMVDPDGKIARWYALSTDIDDRKRAEEALNQARSELAHVTRIAALNAMTASIAHEVNQPLTGIITNASTCLRMLKSNPPNIDGAQETVLRTIRDGNRASEVIIRLRTLFSMKQIDLEPLDLNEAAREVVTLLSGELQRNSVILKYEFSDRLPAVNGDRVQLQQVILNLIRNGSDAMNTVNDRPKQLLIKTETDGDHVTVSVQDSGIGFSPEISERLFESFFTTKREGMGIGLSVSRSIVEAHQGRLWAVQNDGPGATFAFSIPQDFGIFQIRQMNEG